MGFREDALTFKLGLPSMFDISLSEADRRQAEELMEEALVLKKMLDPAEEHSPAHRYQEVKQVLAKLATYRSVKGFRHGKIAFTSMPRTTASGLEYIVNAIEELPE